MLDAEREQALIFLRAVFPEIPENCAILIWTLKDRRSHWATSHAQAVELADAAGGKDVYVGCCLQPRGLGPSKRGTSSTVLAMPGFWADVDFGAEDHKGKKNYPSTLEEAQVLCESMPWLPSPLVMSGHGLQAWWLFKELWLLETAAERARAATLLEGWQRLLASKAEAKGWAVDSTHDLARILRLPGTWNTKNAADPRAVTTLYMPERMYTPEDAEEYLLDELEPVKPAKGKAGKDDGRSGEGWTLCAQAMAPPEKLSLALAQVDGFAETWRRKRKLHGPRGDQSLSAYDYSLAVQMTRLGWTDQQIVDALVQFRREQGEPKLRVDYYRTTLTRARKAGEPSEIEEEIDAWEVQRAEGEQDRAGWVEPEPEAKPDSIVGGGADNRGESQVADPGGTFARHDVSVTKRDAARNIVSSWLGYRVDRIEQTRSEEPVFTLVTERGTIRIGPVSTFRRQDSFIGAVATMTHEEPAALKPKKWKPAMLNALWDLTVVVDVGDEATAKGHALAVLTAYFQHYRPTDSEEIDQDATQDIVQVGVPVIFGEYVYFSGEHFGQWYATHYHTQLPTRERGIKLRSIGGVQTRHRWRSDGAFSQIRSWKIPRKVVDVTTEKAEDDQQ